MSENQVVFLEGKKTILRPYQESDLPLVTRWMNDQDILQFIGRPPVPITQKVEAEAVERMTRRDDDIFLIIAIKETGEAIGTMGLHRISWINGTGVTGSLIGKEGHRGKGFGTDAKMVLLHHAFVRLNLRIVGATVLSSNPRSLACMKKCGYKECGKRKGWIWRNGSYVDEIFTQVTREDFMPLWQKFLEQQ